MGMRSGMGRSHKLGRRGSVAFGRLEPRSFFYPSTTSATRGDRLSAPENAKKNRSDRLTTFLLASLSCRMGRLYSPSYCGQPCGLKRGALVVGRDRNRSRPAEVKPCSLSALILLLT